MPFTLYIIFVDFYVIIKILYMVYYYFRYNIINVTVTLVLYIILQHYLKMYNDYAKHYIPDNVTENSLTKHKSMC